MKQFKRTSNKQLGELLIERGVITQEQLQTAIAKQKEKKRLIGEILVELDFATEKDIAQALTCQYGIPYLPLGNYEIDKEILSMAPEDVCRKYCLIPVDKIGKSLTIAMANPLNTPAIEAVELLTGCIVQVFVSTTTEVLQAINKNYPKAETL
ncbi:MAG: hypothetical protein HQL24_00225 [Candidatus Omnitrophica bacterium]|nr:hypothetical protein [Candidatus Omnitrophota bacterium]